MTDQSNAPQDQPQGAASPSRPLTDGGAAPGGAAAIEGQTAADGGEGNGAADPTREGEATEGIAAPPVPAVEPPQPHPHEVAAEEERNRSADHAVGAAPGSAAPIDRTAPEGLNVSAALEAAADRALSFEEQLARMSPPQLVATLMAAEAEMVAEIGPFVDALLKTGTVNNDGRKVLRGFKASAFRLQLVLKHAAKLTSLEASLNG